MKKNIFTIVVAMMAMVLVGCGSGTEVEIPVESQIEEPVIVVENEVEPEVEEIEEPTVVIDNEDEGFVESAEDTEIEIEEENGMITKIVDGQKRTMSKEYWEELEFNSQTNNW